MHRRPGLILIAGEASGVGKTLLGEKLARLLASQGLHVAAVKHVHHGVDYRVKDTGRYLAAGADPVIALGPGEYMIVRRRSISLEEALCIAAEEADVILVEGFREARSVVEDLGGCWLYVARSGSVEAGLGGRRATYPGLEEAAAAAAEALASGRCAATLHCRRVSEPRE